MKKQLTYRSFQSPGGLRGRIPKKQRKKNVKLCSPKVKTKKTNEHTSVHSGTVHSELSVRPGAVSKKK